MKMQKQVFLVLEIPDPNCTRYIHYRECGHFDDCWGDVMTAEHYASEDEAREEMVFLLKEYGIKAEPRRVTFDITIE